MLLCGLLPKAQAKYKAGAVVVKEGYALVPLTYYGDANRLFAEVKINGRSAILMVDTGMPFCVLPMDKSVHFALLPDLARRGPNKGRRDFKLNGEDALLAQADLSIGPVQSTNLKMAELKPGGQLVGSLRMGDLAGLNVDGILGANFLIQHDAVIDVQRHELFVKVDPKAPDIFALALPKGKWSSIPVLAAGERIVVPGQVEGVAARLIVDTGAPYTSLSARFCQQAGVHDSFFTFSEGVLGYGDDLEAKGKVRDFRVGNYAVRNQELAASPSFDRAFMQSKTEKPFFAGLLGIDFLGNNLAFIDYGNRTIYLKKP